MWESRAPSPLQSSALKLRQGQLRQGQGPRAIKATHRNSYLCCLDLHGRAHCLRFSFLNLVYTAVVTSNRYKFGVCYADRAGTPMGPTMEIKLPIKSVLSPALPWGTRGGLAQHTASSPAHSHALSRESPSFSQREAQDLLLLLGHRRPDVWFLTGHPAVRIRAVSHHRSPQCHPPPPHSLLSPSL